MKLTLRPFTDTDYGGYTVDDPDGAKALIDDEATVSGHASDVVAGAIDGQTMVSVGWYALPANGFQVEIIDPSCFDPIQTDDGLMDTHHPWCIQSLPAGAVFDVNTIAELVAKIERGIKITLI
jgi:hypothetical protein